MVVQGYGNAGVHRGASCWPEFGCKVIAVSDSKGGIVNKSKGLDPEAVLKHKEATKSVVGFNGADSITNKDLLELPCDILVPAALEKVITERKRQRTSRPRSSPRRPTAPRRRRPTTSCTTRASS